MSNSQFRNQSRPRNGLAQTARKYFLSGFVIVSFAAYTLHQRQNEQDLGAVGLPTPTPAARQLALGKNITIAARGTAAGLVTAPKGRPAGDADEAAVKPASAPAVPTQAAAANTSAPATNTPVQPATPTTVPSSTPTTAPTAAPSDTPTSAPSSTPTTAPTAAPSDTPTSAPTDTPTAAPTQGPALASSVYRDGQYTGPSVDAFYGQVQVAAVIKNGQLTEVQIIDYPHDRRVSQRINSIALPYLQQEAVQAQSAQIDLISGATLTSEGFVESLQSALTSAHS